jgi:glutamate formiminotransferase / 5-formyltetrahydrofolate cyclo-ligase
MTMNEAIIECVPNFSEGVDRGKVCAIIGAMRGENLSLLDWSMDSAHNRSVVTIAGPPGEVVQAAVSAVGKAAELIDLTTQRGVHPRMGAADVIPFVPVSGISLEQCVILARQAGWEIWKRYGIPVYFYGAAAARPDRAELEDVRRGQFEGLRELALRDAARRPDIGGPELHASAGATAVAARKFLVAYNLYLDKPDVAAARAIARTVRASGGGLPGVKAMGVLVHEPNRERAQISMNITDLALTSVGEVYAAVSRLAARHATKVVDGELIGLLPEQVFEPDSEWVRLLVGFKPEEKILERRLKNPLDWPQTQPNALK